MPRLDSLGGNTISFYQTKKSSNSPNLKNKSIKDEGMRKDIYAQMPLRLLGYSNELGEAIRPLSSTLANLSWLPAIGYICADIADKYRQDEYSVKDHSKKRASKQLITQLLMSVLLPTLAVKSGQGLTNRFSSFGDTKLTINSREKISNFILESMKQGIHKDFILVNGKIDKVAYNASLSNRLKEILKHKNTHKKLNPLASLIDFLKKPFIVPIKQSNIEKYSMKVINRVVDERQNLIDGIKPEKMSKLRFKNYLNETKNCSKAEKQSIAYDFIRKSEKRRMFNNKVLKSLGGLLALGIMSKPIDEFVKNIAMNQFVNPQIDNLEKRIKSKKAAGAA